MSIRQEPMRLNCDVCHNSFYSFIYTNKCRQHRHSVYKQNPLLEKAKGLIINGGILIGK